MGFEGGRGVEVEEELRFEKGKERHEKGRQGGVIVGVM